VNIGAYSPVQSVGIATRRKTVGMYEIHAEVFALVQRPAMCIGPEMKMHMKQKRVSESDADDCNRVRNAQECGPGVWPEIEKIVQCDDEVTGVPAAHCQGEECQEALDGAQLATVSNKLE
jgi:hypothetical protein